MPALPVPQQSDWSNNVYVVATTRIFVMIGMAYLIKSLYNLVQSTWGARAASMATGGHSFPSKSHPCTRSAKSRQLTSFCHRIAVADGIDLEDVISDALVPVPGAVATEPDLEANLTLQLRPPHPVYDPHDHAARPRAHTPVENQGTEVPSSSTLTDAMPEEDVGVHSGHSHVGGDMDITAGIMS